MITPKGLYQRARLPFGVCSWPWDHHASRNSLRYYTWSREDYTSRWNGRLSLCSRDHERNLVALHKQDWRVRRRSNLRNVRSVSADCSLPAAASINRVCVPYFLTSIHYLKFHQLHMKRKELHAFLCTANYSPKGLLRFLKEAEPFHSVIRNDVPLICNRNGRRHSSQSTRKFPLIWGGHTSRKTCQPPCPRMLRL